MTYNWTGLEDTDYGNGIHIRSRRGVIGNAWWTREWMDTLEQVCDPQELELGRRMARKSQILDLTVDVGETHAMAAESRDSIYHPQLDIPILDDHTWQTIIDEITRDSYLIAMLYAAKIPKELSDVFRSAGAELIGTTPPHCTCSCEVEFRPCRHNIAAACVLAERLDEDPFILFHAMGRSKEEVCNAVRASWDAPPLHHQVTGRPQRSLETLVHNFYRNPSPLPRNSGTVELPTIDVLECLGHPPFFPDNDRNIQRALDNLYRK